MNILFFPRIALSGIRNNKRLYYPYFITAICVVSMFYIICFLTFDNQLASLPFFGSGQQILELGIFVIGLFAILFLLYTNSFLNKRRRKEFGLYNVLGMSKKNIGFILFFETLYTAIISLAIGIGCGILFSKLFELILIRIIVGDISFKLAISLKSIKITIALFVPIFIFLMLVNLFGIGSKRTVDLVKAEELGDKKPRANWLIGIFGLAILTIAYYFALGIETGLGVIIMFFFAVLLVIVATYLIFSATSVVACELMKKNKNYYYQTNHFITTSSMSFRMKRNGAGLATICILSTMVLVMISSTACLYFGVNQVLDGRFPKEYMIEYRFNDAQQINEDIATKIDKTISQTIIDNGYHLTSLNNFQNFSIAGYFKDKKFISDVSARDDFISVNVGVINVIPLSDYNHLTRQNIKLNNYEAILYDYENKINIDYIELTENRNYKIVDKQVLGIKDEFLIGAQNYSAITNTMCLIVNNYEECKNEISSMFEYGAINSYYSYNFDIEASAEEKIVFRNTLSNVLLNSVNCSYVYLGCKTAEKDDAVAMYGTLFFLGIMLSLVFGFANVLIIYYKQICEGYEDQPKFEIMKKVGITDKDIRKTINTQMLTVFFFPLGMAFIHLAFASKMIMHLLSLLNFNNNKTFIISMIVCSLIYGLIYAIIYKITSNVYYEIVNTNINELS